ncbi:MAG: BT_3928 family protein [Rikenellaceae bacterium]
MQRYARYILWIATALAAAIFIFSGFVKIADPWGGAIKIEEYLTIYSLEWLKPLSMWLSVGIAMGEFMIGLLLLMRVYLRVVSAIYLAAMVVFTTISLLSATLLPIGDCGCFGEAIKLTPWQTFYKNIPLLAVAIALFLQQRGELLKPNRRDNIILLSTLVFSSALAIYTTQSMPLLDFTPYRKGSDLRSLLYDNEVQSQSSVKLIYRNIVSGELREFNLEDTQWRDSDVWEWVETRSSVKSEGSEFIDFAIYDEYNGNITREVLTSSTPTTLLVIRDIKELNQRSLGSILKDISLREVSGERVYLISTGGNLPTELSHLKQATIDYTTLKTMLRPAIGSITIEDGVITQKVRYR